MRRLWPRPPSRRVPPSPRTLIGPRAGAGAFPTGLNRPRGWNVRADWLGRASVRFTVVGTASSAEGRDSEIRGLKASLDQLARAGLREDIAVA